MQSRQFRETLSRVSRPPTPADRRYRRRRQASARSVVATGQKLGPSENVGNFRLAPGRKKAYALRSQIGLYEFWTFDLENKRVGGKTEFKGRPRMGLTTSSNGQYLYIHTAGRTIDLYDSQTFKLVRTIDLPADMTRFLLVPPRAAQ